MRAGKNPAAIAVADSGTHSVPGIFNQEKPRVGAERAEQRPGPG